MRVIVCVDNRMGMQFNGRRQSRDQVLNDYLLNLRGTHPMHMNSPSQKLFQGQPNIQVSDNFLSQAGPEDYCFVEDLPLKPWEQDIEQLILCKWNRDYPGDRYLDLELSQWKQISCEEFPGSSHEKITVEVYTK